MGKNKWTQPSVVEISYFKNKSEDQSACISADGNIMLFSIESFGSHGNEDIYVSFKQPEDSWSEPKNLGGTINTKFQEFTPFLAEDNKTLYFASNGHGGLGSRDIFVSRRLDDTWNNWSRPVNLGDTINTEGMELSLVIPPGGDYVYVVSTQNSDGYGDINKINISPEVFEQRLPAIIEEPIIIDTIAEVIIDTTSIARVIDTIPEIVRTPIIQTPEPKADILVLEGKILNAKTQQPIYALLTFENALDESQKEVIETDTVNGTYRILLSKNNNYNVKVSARRFFSKNEKLEIVGQEVSELNLVYFLIPLVKGVTIDLKNVFFVRGTSHIISSSFTELDRVVSMMKENPTVFIELSGHTDNRGDSNLNLKLSQQRAAKVKEYLVSKGIEKRRIVSKGYGSTRPKYSNKNEEARKLNRRVEFTILKN